MSEARNILNNIQYREAIDYYKQLKQRFLQQYFSESDRKKDIKEAQKKIYKDIGTFFQKEDKSKQNEFFKDTLLPLLNNLLLNDSSLAEIERIKNQFEKDVEVRKKELEEYISKSASLTSELQTEIEEQLKKHFQSIGASNESSDVSSISLTDLYAQAKALRSSMIKNQISGKKDNSNLYFQQHILVGYLRESLVAALFAKKLSKAAKVKQSGNQKISKIISGRKLSIDSGIDVLIGKFNDLQQTLNALEGDEKQELNLNSLETFGIQVKSWLGKSDNISSSDFSLGYRKNLFDQFLDSEKNINNHIDNINRIGKSMLFFNENTQAIKEVLGPANVAWVTGNNFYFTDAFISQHRAAGYLFAFSPKTTEGKKASYSDPNSYQLTQKVRFLKLERGLNMTKK